MVLRYGMSRGSAGLITKGFGIVCAEVALVGVKGYCYMNTAARANLKKGVSMMVWGRRVAAHDAVTPK